MKNTKNIIETAVEAGTFQTLIAAITAAGLTETLSGPGPFTVFAPSDDAFAKLPENVLTDLLKPENKAKLAGILTYHVLPGTVNAAYASKMTTAKTVNGQSVKMNATNGVTINGAKVVTADIAASNGLIHVIDAVLLPEAAAKV